LCLVLEHTIIPDPISFIQNLMYHSFQIIFIVVQRSDIPSRFGQRKGLTSFYLILIDLLQTGHVVYMDIYWIHIEKSPVETKFIIHKGRDIKLSFTGTR